MRCCRTRRLTESGRPTPVILAKNIGRNCKIALVNLLKIIILYFYIFLDRATRIRHQFPAHEYLKNPLFSQNAHASLW